MPPQEAVIAHKLAAGLRILESGVKAHGRATVRGKFGDGRTNAHAFIFAKREWLVVERAADVTRLQGSLAQNAGGKIRVVGQVAGAVPEIILVLSPQVARQKAA